ncbi:MAG: hypothetical protein JWQ26_1087 [Modestobacter sp.]|nr:hypothetical protein [Modestobacter sp.]
MTDGSVRIGQPALRVAVRYGGDFCPGPVLWEGRSADGEPAGLSRGAVPRCADRFRRTITRDVEVRHTTPIRDADDEHGRQTAGSATAAAPRSGLATASSARTASSRAAWPAITSREAGSESLAVAVAVWRRLDPRPRTPALVCLARGVNSASVSARAGRARSASPGTACGDALPGRRSCRSGETRRVGCGAASRDGSVPDWRSLAVAVPVRQRRRRAPGAGAAPPRPWREFVGRCWPSALPRHRGRTHRSRCDSPWCCSASRCRR